MTEEEKNLKFKKTADQLLFDNNDKVSFRSMVVEGKILDDNIQKNKV